MKNRLAHTLNGVRPISCFCGFDGFVDEIVHAVDRRFDAEHYARVSTMAEYGRRIAAGSGLSLNIEIVTIDRKIGGNGPIFANALMRLGSDVTYLGSVGREAVHPVFAELAAGGRVIGIADPAQTDAMEFSDGKIIRSKLSPLGDVTWAAILERVGLSAFVSYLLKADLIAFNNWTMLPHMTAIWDGILAQALPLMQPEALHGKLLFFDLADPEKRTREDLLAALLRIRSFGERGFHTVLGLNRKEACEVAEVLGCAIADYRAYPLEELTRFLYARLGVGCVVVHPVDCAACADARGYFEVEGPYCAEPILTTGAGDHFNAGYMFGAAQRFEAEDCLLLGVASSGYYVRTGQSPTLRDIPLFLSDWNEGRLV